VVDDCAAPRGAVQSSVLEQLLAAHRAVGPAARLAARRRPAATRTPGTQDARAAAALGARSRPSARAARPACRWMRTVRHAAWPLAPSSRLNGPLARGRHLAWTARPLQDVKDHFDTTINDVVLTVSAGALRSLMLGRDEDPIDLKAMVPVSVRTPGDEWGNRLAFLFPHCPARSPTRCAGCEACRPRWPLASRPTNRRVPTRSSARSRRPRSPSEISVPAR